MKRITWTFLLSLFTLLSFQSVSAQIVTINFSGTVDVVYGTSVYSPGTPVAGTISFDDSTPNTSPYPEHAEYRVNGPLPAQTGLTSLTIGSSTYTQNLNTGDAMFIVVNDVQDWSGAYPTIDVVDFTTCCQTGTLSNGLSIEMMHLSLNDGPNNPLSSNNLTSAFSSSSNFDSKTMGVFGSNGAGGYYDLQIKINSVSIGGAASAPTGPQNLVAFDSVVTRISDTTGQITSLIREGESITGNFTFDPNLIAMNPPNPEFAFYKAPGDDNNNISINFAGQTIVTNLNSNFKIEIRNYEPDIAGADRFFVSATIFEPIPLMNGSVIQDLRIEFINPPAQNLSSTDLLSSTPSDLSNGMLLTYLLKDATQMAVSLISVRHCQIFFKAQVTLRLCKQRIYSLLVVQHKCINSLMLLLFLILIVRQLFKCILN